MRLSILYNQLNQLLQLFNYGRSSGAWGEHLGYDLVEVQLSFEKSRLLADGSLLGHCQKSSIVQPLY